MTLTHKTAGLMALSALLLFSSCKGSGTATPDVPKKGTTTIQYLDATSYTVPVFFSLKEGKPVTPADPAKDLTWDIAFNRQHLIVNGAEHYGGKGAIARSQVQAVDKVTSTAGLDFIGNSTFKDEKVGGMGPDKDKTIDRCYASKKVTEGKRPRELFAAYDIDMSKMMQGAAAMYQPVKDVFVVRAADGKTCYALLFTGCVDAQGKKGGTLSFTYREI